MMDMFFIGLGFTLINLAILAFNLKLYTEVLKDRSQDRRHGARIDDMEGGLREDSLDAF